MVDALLKQCTSCKSQKPPSAFWSRKTAPYGLYSQCKSCFSSRKRAVRLEKFGLSFEGYEGLVVSQNGLCAICQNPPDERRNRLVIDHDHETDVVRGLLCDNCNLAIGFFRDDIVTLKRAIEYLQKGGVNG